MSYRYVVKQYDSYSFYDGEKFSSPAIGIGVSHPDSSFIYPSPLTNFIKSTSNRKGQAINSQSSLASEIVKFLNYCIDNIENHSDFLVLKDKGLFGLDLIHGAEYISYYTARVNKGEIQSEYVYLIDYYLTKFYEWLHHEQIISISDLDTYKDEEKYSPFDDLELGTTYPKRGENVSNKIVDFGKNRLSLTFKFLKIAEVVAPEIALGIAFQFFGGFRKSEVVNIKKQSFKTPKFNDTTVSSQRTFILNIKDNQDDLFSHLYNHTHEQVKRPREQSVMPFKIVNDILRRHKNDLLVLEKRGLIQNKNAVFVDYQTGEPINGQQYYRRFNNVKEAFLEQLSKEHHVDFDFLNENRWSTHIGRGVFTNILLDRGADIVATTIARGDKYFDTVLKYVDQRRALEYTQDAVNQLHEELSKHKDRMLKSYESGQAYIDVDSLHWEGGKLK